MRGYSNVVGVRCRLHDDLREAVKHVSRYEILRGGKLASGRWRVASEKQYAAGIVKLRRRFVGFVTRGIAVADANDFSRAIDFKSNFIARDGHNAILRIKHGNCDDGNILRIGSEGSTIRHQFNLRGRAGCFARIFRDGFSIFVAAREQHTRRVIHLPFEMPRGGMDFLPRLLPFRNNSTSSQLL